MKRLAILVCIIAGVSLVGCSSGGPSGGGPAKVTVDPDIFDRQGIPYEEPEAGWAELSPYFLVNSNQPDKAAAALHVASGRIMHVDSNGNMVTDSELADPQDYSKYTPNYCSPVYLTEAGPVIYVDTKGELPRAMANTMVRIIVEELAAQDIAANLTSPPLGSTESIYASPEWEPPTSASSP